MVWAMQLILGNFVNGKRHGHGVYVYTNGDVYQGNWSEDIKEGAGII